MLQLSDVVPAFKAYDIRGVVGEQLDAHVMRALGAAFARLHAECRLLHGDCHLGNVLRRAGGAVFLVDFEYATPLNAAGHVAGREDCSAEDEDYDVDRWIEYAASEAARERARAACGDSDVSEGEPEDGGSESGGE